MSDLSFTLIRGRTAKSKNALRLGFRYSPDGKLRKDGSQSWRCVKKAGSCKGWIWTKGLSLTETPASCNSTQPRSWLYRRRKLEKKKKTIFHALEFFGLQASPGNAIEVTLFYAILLLYYYTKIWMLAGFRLDHQIRLMTAGTLKVNPPWLKSN